MDRDTREIVILQQVLRRARTLLLLTAWLVCLVSSAFGLDVPKLQGYVNDYAGLISTETRASLEAELKNFEATDSTQIVVLTIPSLQGEDIEGFSIRVAEAWKIGQKVKDNGVIFLVAKEDKKMRIEVGRGLEGRLTDLMAGRIIDLVIKPRFKRDDFDGGVTAGVASLIDATRGEFKAEEKDSRKETQPFQSSWLFLLVAVILVFLFLSSARRRAKPGNWAAQSGRNQGRSPGGFIVLPSRREGGDAFGEGDTFGGGGGGTFGGGGASGDW